MKFHIPKQLKLVKERVDVKLDVALLQKLDRYCQYMESDRDYVIGTVLQVVFKKDKGFAAWLAEADRVEESSQSARRARA